MSIDAGAVKSPNPNRPSAEQNGSDGISSGLREDIREAAAKIRSGHAAELADVLKADNAVRLFRSLIHPNGFQEPSVTPGDVAGSIAFKDACNAAGLPHCSAHGLRKATLRRMAELEMSNKSMKSVSGQERDETLAGYIRDADQRRLATAAITRLSAWERGEKCLTSDQPVRHAGGVND